MDWWHSGSPSPAPKNSECKSRWKSSRLDFLGSRRHPSHLLYSKGPNYQRGVLLISAGVIEGLLKEKRGKFTFLYNNAPAHPALAAKKKLAYLGFQYLDHPPYFPDLTPSDYHLFLGLKKTIAGSPLFVRCGDHCYHGDLVGRTKF